MSASVSGSALIGDALRHGSYAVVICNPPYVPAPADALAERIDPRRVRVGVGRRVRTGGHSSIPRAAAPHLLAEGGTVLVVHSKFAGADQTVDALGCVDILSEVVASQLIRSAQCCRPPRCG